MIIILWIITQIRYGALWMSRMLGRIYRWLNSEWRPPVVWLVATTFGAWLTERLLNLPAGTLFELWKILSLYAVLVLLWWAWQARKRTVVEEFADHTSDQPKAVKRGLSTLLVVELARLRELSRTVDEQLLPAVKAGKDIKATVKLDDVSGFLRSAVSAESKFIFGPLEIPVGTLMALIGRLVRGASNHRKLIQG